METLDLFSGIGGFARALHEISKPLAFCEIDKDCHYVLAKNFPRVPIVQDVKTLNPKQFPAQLLTAGFPCQDISGANRNYQGLEGVRSGLFSHILRIVSQNPKIKFLLLENSPFIKTRGLATVVQELQKRKFKLVWSYFEARQVGATHIRRRWICFAWRASPSELPQVTLSQDHNWKCTNIPRVFRKNNSNKHFAKRCAMLGNSVVPQVIQYAWNTLVAAAKNNQQGEIDAPVALANNTADIELTSGPVTYKKQYWATPTFTTWHQYRTLTERSTRVLSNQIHYEKKTYTTTDNAFKDRTYRINPRFVECLMGYPADWTA